MQYCVMINAVKRQCISHVVSGASPEEELPSSVMEVEMEERAATGPPILSHHNSSIEEELSLNEWRETVCLYYWEMCDFAYLKRKCETFLFEIIHKTHTMFEYLYREVMQMFLHDKGELKSAESACEDKTSAIHQLENQQAQGHKLISYAVRIVQFVSMLVHS